MRVETFVEWRTTEGDFAEGPFTVTEAMAKVRALLQRPDLVGPVITRSACQPVQFEKVGVKGPCPGAVATLEDLGLTDNEKRWWEEAQEKRAQRREAVKNALVEKLRPLVNKPEDSIDRAAEVVGRHDQAAVRDNPKLDPIGSLVKDLLAFGHAYCWCKKYAGWGAYQLHRLDPSKLTPQPASPNYPQGYYRHNHTPSPNDYMPTGFAIDAREVVRLSTAHLPSGLFALSWLNEAVGGYTPAPPPEEMTYKQSTLTHSEVVKALEKEWSQFIGRQFTEDDGSAGTGEVKLTPSKLGCMVKVPKALIEGDVPLTPWGGLLDAISKAAPLPTSGKSANFTVIDDPVVPGDDDVKPDVVVG